MVPFLRRKILDPPLAYLFTRFDSFRSPSNGLLSAFNPSLLKRVADTLRSAVPRTFFTTSGVGFYFSCRGMSTLIWYRGSSTPPIWIYQPTAPLTSWIVFSNQTHTNADSAPQFFSQCVKKCLENWPYVTVLTKSKNKKVLQRCFNRILPVRSFIIFEHYF